MRPTKTTDSRSKGFEGDSVEVDAIDPLQLRFLVAEAIESHIDQAALGRTRMIEEQERNTLARFAEGFKDVRRDQIS